jgi:hypothetical protein
MSSGTPGTAVEEALRQVYDLGGERSRETHYFQVQTEVAIVATYGPAHLSRKAKRQTA